MTVSAYRSDVLLYPRGCMIDVASPLISVCAGGSAGHPVLLLPGEVPGESSVCPYCIYYNQLSDGENVNEQPEEQRHGHSCHSNSPCHCSSSCLSDAQLSEPKKRLWECGWARLRTKLELIVGSRYFSRGIMIAILINTLSMGIEYHEQVSVRTCVGCAPLADWLRLQFD